MKPYFQNFKKISTSQDIVSIIIGVFMVSFIIDDVIDEAIQKFFILLVICIFAVKYYRDRGFINIPGSGYFAILAITPFILHGSRDFGFIAAFLLTLSVVNIISKKNQLIIINKYAFAFVYILFLIVYFEILLTLDIMFLRDGEHYFEFTKYLIFHNPNEYSRALVIVAPLYFSLEKNKHLSSNFIGILVFSIFSVVVIAQSRANILAIISMLMVWAYYEKEVNLKKFFLSALIVLIVIGGIIGVSDKMKRKSVRIINIIENTIEMIDAGVIPAQSPARSKVIATSISVILDHPITGVGSRGKEKINEYGAVRYIFINDKLKGNMRSHPYFKYNNELYMTKGDTYYQLILNKDYIAKNIAVHGGFLNTLVSYGIVGLLLFLLVLYCLLKYFHKAAARYKLRSGVAGQILVISTIFSQLGGNIYANYLFWLILAILIASVEIERSSSDAVSVKL